MNFIISILGWIVWNVAECELDRRSKEEDNDDKTVFTYSGYAKSHLLVWFGSLACVPIILWFGYKRFQIDPAGDLFGGGTKAWEEIYILAAGAAFEAFIFAVKKIKARFAKMGSEL